MGTWIYPWKNGDVTAVSAPSKFDAIEFLERIGPFNEKDVKAFTRGFAVTFSQGPTGGWTHKSVSSSLQHELDVIYVDGIKGRRRKCPSKS